MKSSISLMILTALAFSAQAQIRPLPARTWPESDSTSVYVVDGFRHGVAYFPKARSPHVEYEATDVLSFDKYHSAGVIYTWMERFAARWPDLVDLYEVGRSYEGRPVIQMTVTNKKSGPATEKPAAFFEGNRHSGEVSSAESVMWLMQHLLENYGGDDEITRIVDRNAIYLRPINNPDGHNLYIHTAQSNRSTVRAFDNDGDGLLDEDPPVDLDGDGRILRMRYKDPGGDYVIDERDPAGRVMKRVAAGKGTHKMTGEGVDADGDGRFGEDGIGGLDLHRNYPENWRPMREATGRGWTQGGAGEYPLSEIETRLVFDFLMKNPNIYIVNSMDTRVPMHLRAPSTSAPEDRMYPEDNAWYERFDELGKSTTGYERAGSVYADYGDNVPLFGHGPDFGYWYYGAIWYGDEIWDGARDRGDLNSDGEKDELDQLLWDETENGGMGFTGWKTFRHPTLGEVEIGGWDPKFYSQNAPSRHMASWAGNQALFNLGMVKHLPLVEWADHEIKREKSYRGDSIDYRVTLRYRNAGKLPTALRQADLVKIVKPDRFDLEFDAPAESFRVLDVSLDRVRAVRNAPPADPAAPVAKYFKEAGYAAGESVNAVEFRVRGYRNVPLKFRARLTTTRAGSLPEKEITVQ